MSVTLVEDFAAIFMPLIIDKEKHEITAHSHRKITVDERPNGNIRLFAYTLVGEDWIPMTSIEVEIYRKTFWTETAKALLLLSERQYGGSFTLDEVVQGLLLDFPQGLPLIEERNLPDDPLPRKKRKVTEGTIHSTGKAVAKFPTQESEND